uniref:Leucine-rich repeat-containing protein 51 n=1 Tax=Lotharella globosa TaxID=91324 RepID=A0A7S3YVG8_9EUKA
MFLFVAIQIIENPGELTWLDLSYNKLTDISKELMKFPKLSMLYLHGNNIRDLNEVKKLTGLVNLKKLTLHGNQNVIDKGTRFLKMVKAHLKNSKAESLKSLGKLPVSRIKEQCALLKKFGINYTPGNKMSAVKHILKFIYADITNRHFRPPAGPSTSMEDKKIITLEDIKNYRLKVIAYVPTLIDLDYIGVTPKERETSWRQVGSKLPKPKEEDEEDEDY